MKLGTGLLFAMVVMVISWSRYLDQLLGGGGGVGPAEAFLYRSYLFFAASAVMLILGLPIAAASWKSLRRGSVGLDSLIVLGIFAAYGRSLVSTFSGHGEVFYDTATMILVLVTLGHYLESEAKARASAALRALFDLTPRQAIVIREGQEQRVDVASVAVGETVRVRPGEAFPVDGQVLEGEGSAGEAVLTGESAPAFKRPGDRVFAGTQDLDGAFLVITRGVGDQTAVGRLAKFLDEARQAKAPMARIADRVAAVILPLAITIALACFVFWGWRVSPDRGLMVALAVLLITCPCALGIATPLALWSGLGEAARRGILIRSGEALETLTKVNHVYFDKTGTLTTGDLTLSSVTVCQEPDGQQSQRAPSGDDELISIAASLACLSKHPVAEAIVRFAAGSKIAVRPVQEFRSWAGLGLQGRLEGQDSPVYLGSRLFMERAGLLIDAALREDRGGAEAVGHGKTMLYAGWDGRARALFVLREEVRPEAAQAISRLKRMGIAVSVLTGDGQPAAEALKAQLGIDDVRWGLMPEDKVRLLQQAKEGGRVAAMVGDGVNDAPALATAAVGIAMGCGTDIAREAAGANLLGSDLRHVPELIALARQTRRLIAGNLFWAIFYNVVAIPFAASGLLAPVISALAMVSSSLFVVGNSFRKWAPEPATPLTTAGNSGERGNRPPMQAAVPRASEQAA
ncbi:MAG: cation-translocating P-type ATPase [Anaerolineales bacterium]|nr:cation-translocating P-type ATPase [Anaerolineales bacterium]